MNPSPVGPYGYLIVLLTLVLNPALPTFWCHELTIGYLAYERHQGPRFFTENQNGAKWRSVPLSVGSSPVICQFLDARDLFLYLIDPLGDVLERLPVEHPSAIGHLESQQKAV